MTSRIDALFVSSITSLSTPRPIPAVGGMPYSSAVTKSSSMAMGYSLSLVLRERLLTLRLRRRPRALLRHLVRLDLRLQPFALVHRIRELAERVGELAADDEQLEPLRHPGLGSVRLCQRRNFLRVVQHKRGLPQLGLHGSLEHLVQDVAHARCLLHPGDAAHGLLIAERTQRRLRGGFSAREVTREIPHHVNAGGFHHQVVHGRPSPRPVPEVDDLVAVLDRELPAVRALAAVADHFLGELQHVGHVRVRL